MSTLTVDPFGWHAAVAQAKSLIVTPGLWILIPAMAATGGSGISLSMSRKARLVEARKRRVAIVAANGLLVPCAIPSTAGRPPARSTRASMRCRPSSSSLARPTSR